MSRPGHSHQGATASSCVGAIMEMMELAIEYERGTVVGADLVLLRRAIIELVEDGERLDFLIDWLSHHDDLEGSGIRDWDNNADARAAIDAARGVPPAGETGTCRKCERLYSGESCPHRGARQAGRSPKVPDDAELLADIQAAIRHTASCSALRGGACDCPVVAAEAALAHLTLRKRSERPQALPSVVSTPAPTEPECGATDPPDSPDNRLCYGCSEPMGHSGDHIARGTRNQELHRWPSERPTPAPQEER